MTPLNDILVLIISIVLLSLTNWLPISTSGHRILLEDMLAIDTNSTFYAVLPSIIQLGGAAAVFLLYFKRLNPFSREKKADGRKNTWFLWLKLTFASLPAVVIALAFYEPVRRLFYRPGPIAVMMIIYSVLMFGVDNKDHGKHAKKIEKFEDISFSAAFKIGFFQLFSIIPGISRPAAIMTAGLFQGVVRKVAADFTVLISLPTFLLLSISRLFTFPWELILEEWVYLILVFSLSFLISIISILFFINYLNNHKLTAFSTYSIILAGVLLSYFFLF